MTAARQVLRTCISLSSGSSITFDFNAGIDCSSALFASPPVTPLFGLPLESRQTVYSLKDTAVSVEHLSICCHNNRTHTESTKHVYADGLSVSQCHPSSAACLGCVVLSVDPVCVRSLKRSGDEFEYDGECSDEDRIVTRSMIGRKLAALLSPLAAADAELSRFVRQCVFVRLNVDGEAAERGDWPFLDCAAMQLLHDEISHVLGVNLPSVDRMVSPKVPNHCIWFARNAKSERLITEGLCIPDEVADGVYVLNLQLAPFADTDAVPCRPILFACEVHMMQRAKL